MLIFLLVSKLKKLVKNPAAVLNFFYTYYTLKNTYDSTLSTNVIFIKIQLEFKRYEQTSSEININNKKKLDSNFSWFTKFTQNVTVREAPTFADNLNDNIIDQSSTSKKFAELFKNGKKPKL